MKQRIIITIIVLLGFSSYALAQSVASLNVSSSITVDAKHREWLEGVLSEGELKTKEPSTVALLRTLAKGDAERLLKTLRAEGYYGAEVTLKIKSEAKPINVTFDIKTGEQFTLKSIDLKAQSSAVSLPKPSELPLTLGGPFRAEAILKAKKKFAKLIEEKNCLHTIEVDHKAIIDHKTQAVALELILAETQKASFGQVSFEGLETLDEAYLRGSLPWKSGDCFKPSLVEKARNTLIGTNFFVEVEKQVGKNPNATGQTPITFIVKERPHRTVKVGVGINSDEGVALSAGWEHRNFFGNGQKLEVNSYVSTLLRSLETKYTQPLFLQKDQSLALSAAIEQEELDAFDALSLTVSGKIRRNLANNWVAGVGSTYSLSEVKDEGETETFGLLSFPVFIEHDTRDDILNPQKGHSFQGEVAPYVDTLGSNTGFLKSRVNARTYFGFDTTYNPVIAFRGSLGSIVGTANADIPADERFYAGGGNSVRGYGFKELGRLSGGSAIGGRSLVELSSELRLRFNNTIGGVAFLDGGNVYEDVYPSFDSDLQWATGLGIRYYTEFVPIRLDIATPLNKRSGIDDAYQFYISIGQAF